MNNFNAYVYQGADQYNFGAFAAYGKYVVYQEGIYLGYKYTETRYEDKVMGTENVGDYVYGDVVSYPFGFGLSYSSFDFSDMKVEKTGAGRDAAYVMTVTGNGPDGWCWRLFRRSGPYPLCACPGSARCRCPCGPDGGKRRAGDRICR